MHLEEVCFIICQKKDRYINWLGLIFFNVYRSKSKLLEDKFARGNRIAQKHFCIKGQFCTTEDKG